MRAVEIDAGERFRAVGLDAIADDDPPTEADLLAHVLDGRAWVAGLGGGLAGAGGEPEVKRVGAPFTPVDAGAAATMAHRPSGPVVGYATASVVDGEGHLDQVSVIGAAAGHGIGALLVDQVCRWAGSSGYHAVSLTTFRDVPWNGTYYRRLGFVEIPEDGWGPQLRAIRQAERLAGIDVRPRIAMRKVLHPGS